MEKQGNNKQKVLQIVTPGKTLKTKGKKSEFELIINPDKDPNLMKESNSKSFLEWLGEEGGAGDQGTNKLVKKYKKDTPCATCKKEKCECVNESAADVVSADRERYKVMTRTGAKWYTKRRARNILSKRKKEVVTEHIALTEEDTSKIKKVLFLAQQGLVKASELNRYKVTIRKLLQTKSLTQDEKDYLNSKYDNLLSMIVNDPQLYQRFRAIIQ